MTELLIDRIDSAIGTILVVSDGESLCALDYAGCEQRMMKLLHARYGRVRLREATDPLGFSSRMRAYLTGDLGCVNRIPINTGGTAFQQQVWSALRAIPPGTVFSYGELAARLGKPTAYRAVGMTNALNPIAIVVPCHRLVGANGALTGYAGGLERKQWLLQHEGVDLAKLAHARAHIGSAYVASYFPLRSISFSSKRWAASGGLKVAESSEVWRVARSPT